MVMKAFYTIFIIIYIKNIYETIFSLADLTKAKIFSIKKIKKVVITDK